MNRRTVLSITTLSIACLIGSVAYGQNNRPVTPLDCVTVKYFTTAELYPTMQVSPDGRWLAYLVKSPDLNKNIGVVQLYVVQVSSTSTKLPKLLLTAEGIERPTWEEDGIHVLALAKLKGHKSILEIDRTTGQSRSAVHEAQDIQEFTSDQPGRNIVFATEAPSGYSLMTHQGRTDDELAKGYRIDFPDATQSPRARRRLWIARRRSSRDRFMVTRFMAPVPFETSGDRAFPYVTNLRLSLSPNGKMLSFSYVLASGQIPSEWKTSPFVETLIKRIDSVLVTIIEDIETNTTKRVLTVPFIWNVPSWSPDSTSLVLTGLAPVASDVEQADIQRRLGVDDIKHVLWVDLNSQIVRVIPASVIHQTDPPVSWDTPNEIAFHTGAQTVSQFTYRDNRWAEVSTINIPAQGLFERTQLTGKGHLIAGDYQATIIPPQLFIFDTKRKVINTIVPLNPQFDHLILAQPKNVEWTTSTGYRITGVLLIPPDYTPGKRYPLVIQTKGYVGQFLCDEGQHHFPSFAPQPLADAGIMYLMRTVDEQTWNAEEELRHYPPGYPAGIAEAAFHTDVWDSAVKALSDMGLVDPARVGIMGFSRSGWYTEFALIHGRTKYRVASVADNVQYSLGEYWLWRVPSILSTYDAVYGGPPYGATLGNWLKYSVSFNLDRIHTPLLLETMGNGVRERSADLTPLALAQTSELFVGLHHLNSPVEFYYYPDESHAPEHPAARLANLTRNVDWIRFWLQGYEAPGLTNSGMYERWSNLRALQDK